MHCRSCGNGVIPNAIVCTKCGYAPIGGEQFCGSCGEKTNAGQIMCVKCGVALSSALARASSDVAVISASDPPKDPMMACVLSVLLVGLGQIVLGQTSKGVAMLTGTFVFVLLTCGWGAIFAPFIWLFSGVDAFKIATKLKNGHSVRQWEFF